MSTQRPTWMQQGTATGSAGARKQPESYIASTLPPAHPTSSTPRYSSHPTVVAGIAIMATMSLMSVYFWVGIWLIGRIAEPGADVYGFVLASDYFSAGRVIGALILASLATAVTWQAARALTE